MSEWMAISQLQDCTDLARPAIVFEIRNADNQLLLTPCSNPCRRCRKTEISARAISGRRRAETNTLGATSCAS
jgi:hypothetical protein